MKKVIITGVSEGLWYELAKICINKEIRVVWISRKKVDIDIFHIPCDLRKKEDIENAVHIISEQHNDFDAIIHCAWILSIQKPDEICYEAISELFQVNVFSQIYINSLLFSKIRDNNADVVLVSSTVWTKAYENQAVYGASKWAVRWIIENLRLELKWTKSRVIWFFPGGFQSRIFEKATGTQADLSAYMKTLDVAKALFDTLSFPKNMEISEVIINRK